MLPHEAALEHPIEEEILSLTTNSGDAPQWNGPMNPEQFMEFGTRFSMVPWFSRAQSLIFQSAG